MPIPRSRIPAHICREIMQEAGHRCAVCGDPCPLQRAHIVPWRKSNSHEPENLLCLCANCHQRADHERWGEKTLRWYKERPWILRKGSLDCETSPRRIVTFKVALESSSFDDNQRRLLKHALAGFLGASPEDIDIIAVEPGSTLLTVELPAESASELLHALRLNDPVLLAALTRFFETAKKPSQLPPVKAHSYFEQRSPRYSWGQLAVAQYIVENLLREEDSIILDGGNSLLRIAGVIAQKAQLEHARMHFTIMTHNYAAFDVLTRAVPPGSRFNLFLTGGRYDHEFHALFGIQTLDAYEHFSPRVVLLGVSGVLTEIGVFCHGNTEELAVKKAIFRKPADERIIVADHTKIGVLDSLMFGASDHLLSNVNRCILVTDKPPPKSTADRRNLFSSQIEALEKRGIVVKQLENT